MRTIILLLLMTQLACAQVTKIDDGHFLIPTEYSVDDIKAQISLNQGKIQNNKNIMKLYQEANEQLSQENEVLQARLDIIAQAGFGDAAQPITP